MKNQHNVRNRFKVNNEEGDTDAPLSNCSGVSIVDFDQVDLAGQILRNFAIIKFQLFYLHDFLSSRFIHFLSFFIPVIKFITIAKLNRPKNEKNKRIHISEFLQ